eukprot:Amastigsp_a179459_26.p5 type:complete len:107 gc:universal Amastigsp_a179459_26:785-465(-)
MRSLRACPVRASESMSRVNRGFGRESSEDGRSRAGRGFDPTAAMSPLPRRSSALTSESRTSGPFFGSLAARFWMNCERTGGSKYFLRLRRVKLLSARGIVVENFFS